MSTKSKTKDTFPAFPFFLDSPSLLVLEHHAAQRNGQWGLLSVHNASSLTLIRCHSAPALNPLPRMLSFLN